MKRKLNYTAIKNRFRVAIFGSARIKKGTKNICLNIKRYRIR